MATRSQRPLDPRAARRTPTRAARPAPPGDERPAHERGLAALASHALALPPLLAAQHAADRVPVPARDPRRRLPPLARARPLRAQGREGDPHLRPRPLPPPRQRTDATSEEASRAAGRLQARRRLRRLPDRAAARRRAGTARPARRAGHAATATPHLLAPLEQHAASLGYTRQLRAARRPRRLLLRPRGAHRRSTRSCLRTGRSRRSCTSSLTRTGSTTSASAAPRRS